MVAPGIRKIKVSNVDVVLPILSSIYLSLDLCPAKFSADYKLSPSVVVIPHM